MATAKSIIGWNFKNTYVNFPDTILTRISPVAVKDPSIAIFNEELSKELGLDFTSINKDSIADVFCGNVLPDGADPIAQAYAGHQFGHFTILGDGRAIILGEHVTPSNDQVDIQYKGSGQTPYSRGADGRAALGPMLREYVISESMYGLGIPTTRSLAVTKTGENVFRDSQLPGAILTRVAKSHIRVGTFQYLAAKGDLKTLEDLVSYSINRHYPQFRNETNLALTLLNAVMEQQINLIVHWMRVGFIHGVMNTDNMTISGETIDYGPCAFMNEYDEETCFSSIDLQGRYSFGNQPRIAQWNLARFAETLIPLISEDEKKSIAIAEESINNFKAVYEKKWFEMMKNKLGIHEEEDKDLSLIQNLLSWMKAHKVDYTNTFCHLMGIETDNICYQNNDFVKWFNLWKTRSKQNNSDVKKQLVLMKKNNPIVIPRNHKVEEALEAANNNDLKLTNKLLSILNKPYDNQNDIKNYQLPSNNDKYQTFCGT